MENSPQQANDYNNKAKQYLGDFHRNLTQDLNNAPNSQSDWERVKPSMTDFYPKESLSAANEDKIS